MGCESKLRRSEISFLAVILLYSLQSVNAVQYTRGCVFRGLNLFNDLLARVCLTSAYRDQEHSVGFRE